MEPMPLPDGGSPDVPSNEELAQRANQPRNAISGDEVGIFDPVCKSDVCASFAADKDEGPQRGSGRPILPLVSKIQVTSTNSGARAQGGLTPDFLALSFCLSRTASSTPYSVWNGFYRHADDQTAEYHVTGKGFNS